MANFIISVPHFQPFKKKKDMDEKLLIISIYSFKFYEGFDIEIILNR